MSNEKLYIELEEICNYDYEEMQNTLNSLQNMLNSSIEYEEEHTRVCSICDKRFSEGYIYEDEYKYYCSNECLHKDYTEEEYLELYDNGNGTFYWTSWEE